MFAAVDVCYPPAPGGRVPAARSALAVFRDAAFSGAVIERTVDLAEVEPYQPGRFFLRELPPILAVVAGIGGIGLLVIDGYVDLDPGGRPGLGAHVHAALGCPVIGVAKTRFRTATHAAPVLRGGSARPLLVTAAGVTLPEAAAMVRRMAGRHRIPDALRRVDALARGQGAGTG